MVLMGSYLNACEGTPSGHLIQKFIINVFFTHLRSNIPHTFPVIIEINCFAALAIWHILVTIIVLKHKFDAIFDDYPRARYYINDMCGKKRRKDHP